VSVSELFTDDSLKPRAVAPLDSVCVLADDAFEDTSVVLVPTEARRFRMFRNRRIRVVVVCVLVLEEPVLRFGVCSPDSLSGGRAKNVFVFAFESTSIGVPYVALEAVFVVVSHEALVVDFVPESGGSVQQVP
jgi:hypothetical protein